MFSRLVFNRLSLNSGNFRFGMKLNWRLVFLNKVCRWMEFRSKNVLILKFG